MMQLILSVSLGSLGSFILNLKVEFCLSVFSSLEQTQLNEFFYYVFRGAFNAAKGSKY